MLVKAKVLRAVLLKLIVPAELQTWTKVRLQALAAQAVRDGIFGGTARQAPGGGVEWFFDAKEKRRSDACVLDLTNMPNSARFTIDQK